MVRVDGIPNTMSDGSVSWDLDQFFGTSFHQDWDLEADNWQGIVDGYIDRRQPTAEMLRNLAGEIDNLPHGRTGSELEQLVAYTIGVDYDPQPIGYKDWLGLVADRLRQHANSIEGGPTSSR
ncbi:contact-dependent growth inhibition system immunity protein [Mycolicibacterium vaccae]|uniref:contact-dependent growth inhibition system immunity protein n=1 Tax=Mycolicibacterium vaccae TaxID=1810 RepID=UPI003D01A39E